MKNIIKKIAAIAMAFALLGTGTAMTEVVPFKTAEPLTVHAAYCNHVVNTSPTISQWKCFDTKWQALLAWQHHYKRTKKYSCVRCGAHLYTVTEYKYDEWVLGDYIKTVYY